jgi:hypothetical protein
MLAKACFQPPDCSTQPLGRDVRRPRAVPGRDWRAIRSGAHLASLIGSTLILANLKRDAVASKAGVGVANVG